MPNLKEISEKNNINLYQLPYSLRVLLENISRRGKDISPFKKWLDNNGKNNEEIEFSPARVLMQDFTGVPAVVDLAAMRDAAVKLGKKATDINPKVPVDLVIDHSVQIDEYGTETALKTNVTREFERNNERYEFLKWGQSAFSNFRVVPPGNGICHQVNLEYLAPVVHFNKKSSYIDSCVGTDSHTTMINGLGVLGWGVGGIEAESAMLGQPISMLLPDVIGFELTGKLAEGVTATDLVLTVVQMLREKGVVGKFVEFYGTALDNMSVADRATIANMAPEYGATCGYFPIDERTVEYLKLTNRENIDKIISYTRDNGFWREDNDIIFTDTLNLDISTVEPSIAGPKRPQDKILLKDAATEFKKITPTTLITTPTLSHGSIVIAAITSCTNTSNPSVMIAAGLMAKKALEKGMKIPSFVKTSLAPGSKVVSEYLERSGLQDHLDEIGFNIVGFGCTTCIGNSGPLNADIEQEIKDKDLFVTSVLSGNRNFEGRVHQLTKANYLMSPPLVLAYALAGNMHVDIYNDEIADGIKLADIWPSEDEINEVINKTITSQMFKEKYDGILEGSDEWNNISIEQSERYNWNINSTYIQNPPFFEDIHVRHHELAEGKRGDLKQQKAEIASKASPSRNDGIWNARIIGYFGDSITTDHISPAGAIAMGSPAAEYLKNNNVEPRSFNSYGSRRGNHEVMMRGTFANIRLKNELLNNVEGSYTLDKNGMQTSIYDACMGYKQEGVPLVVIAGKQYGTGSSRDWAAKGTTLLGIKAVLAESFERIHRSNLIGMGVLPLEFKGSRPANITGKELVNIDLLNLKPKASITANIDGKDYGLTCRIDTDEEFAYYKNGGILHNVLLEM